MEVVASYVTDVSWTKKVKLWFHSGTKLPYIVTTVPPSSETKGEATGSGPISVTSGKGRARSLAPAKPEAEKGLA